MPPDTKSAESQRNVLAILQAVQNGQDLNKDPQCDAKMGSVWFYLKAQDTPHWYCSRASEIVRESAIFLQRLHAYNSDAVKAWKETLIGVIHGCCECAVAYEASKRRSREVYLALFDDQTVGRFFGTVNQWEEEAILQALKDINISPQNVHTLDEIPRGVLFHILANPALCLDNTTFTPMILQHTGEIIKSIPKEVIPGGLQVLAVNRDDTLRGWAQKQLAAMEPDISLPDFKSYYSSTIETLLDYVGHAKPSLSLPFLTISQGVSLFGHVAQVMRPFAEKLLREGLATQRVVAAFRRAIKWLSDSQNYETGVLQFVEICLGVYATEIWAATPANYSDTVITTITKDDRLQRLVCANVAASKENDKSLSWVRSFLCAIWSRPQSKDGLQLTFTYLANLMSNRALPDHACVLAMKAFNGGFNALAGLSPKGNQSYNVQFTALRDAILQHKSIITEAAFQSSIPELRDVARSFLQDVFIRDLKQLDFLRFRLTDARTLSRKKHPFVDKLKEPVVYISLWKEAIRKIDASDHSSMGFIIHIMARSAHIDVLNQNALDFASEAEHKEAVSRLRAFLKATLAEIRLGFDVLMARFSLVCEPNQLDDQMMSDVITLLFSPVPKLHSSALEMFGDCDGRKACIRFALTCRPQAALRGITTFVEAFNDIAGKLTEACSAAKSLVRCFVDVIEALCGPEQDANEDTKVDVDVIDVDVDEETGATVGLLNDPSFEGSVRPMLPALWSNMCHALALILSKCPYWADFFPPQEMVEWMRDALIFGRLMRAHAASFQSLPQSRARGATDPKENGLETMRDVQDELVAWFRLTDAELIYQAYELMMSFLEGGIAPSPVYRAKLERRLVSKDTDLPLPKLEAMKAALDRVAPLEADDGQVVEDGVVVKAEKRRRSVDSVDSQAQVRPAKAPRHEEELIQITSSDDERPAASSSRPARTKQTSISNFIQGGKSSKPSAAAKPAKSSTASKIFVSTIKPSGSKVSNKPKGLSAASGPLARMRAEHAARQQQTAAQRADVQMRSLAKNVPVPPLNSSSPPPTSPSSKQMDGESSSSSDDEDIRKTTLASLAPTVVAKKPEQPKRTMVMLDGPPVLSAKMKHDQEELRKAEELKRRTARLRPNLEGLHEQILRWSIDHDGPQPLSIGGSTPKPTRVLPKFNSKKQYFDVFHPLLINECWSQILQAKEEGLKEPVMCMIMTRSYVDNFTDIAFNIVESTPERWFLSETDIVLLRSVEGDRSILAKITGFKRGSAANQIATGTMRLSTQAEQRVRVQVQEQWKMSKIYSLSTINREYAALTTAEYYDLIDEVLSATSARVSPPAEQRVKQAMQAHRLNEPQAKAILSALGTTGFSLIQGPPGTGKTSTICGLAGSFASTARAAFSSSGSKEAMEKRRLLICAPSNAAIDEVTKRLADGVRDNNGQPLNLKVVRIGTESSMNVSVTANSLDSLVDEKMAAVPKSTSTGTADIAALRQELSEVRKKIDAKRNELDQAPPGQRRIALENEFRTLKTQRTTITTKLDAARDQQRNEHRVLDAARRKFRDEVLKEADVICSTLSGAGHEVLKPFQFETVVIDEAAQAIEIATLIPLRYGCKTCILVGDPQQLPPTVISQLASGLNYNQSLFVRLQRHNPDSVHLLSIQYRMHPSISAVPSRLFYHGRLQDGPDMEERTKQIWHASPLFGPYQFFDVAHGQEEAQSNHSQINRGEADAAVALYDRIRREFKTTNFEYRVGIVSMYRGQVQHIKSRFSATFGSSILKLVDFNTVDGFQGQEKDIIILSCVRAGANVQTVGFLADERRMNVAITRSRSSLFILGHAATLERCNQTWKTIVEDARTRGHLIKCSRDLFRTAPMHKVLNAHIVTKKPEPKQITGNPQSQPRDSSKPPSCSEGQNAIPTISAVSASTEASASLTANLELPEISPPKPPIAPISVPQKNNISHPLPPKSIPKSIDPGLASLPPKPLRPPPPRKKAPISAFIPKDKQKKTQLGGP